MNYHGHHATLDAQLGEMPPPAALLAACERAIEASGMNVVCRVQKDFRPQGLTAVWILEESHFSIHTYPEHNYISVDCYTCGDEGNPRRAIEELKALLQPVASSARYLPRGQV